MRKLFCLFVALLATTSLWAHDFEVDGIYYNYLDGNNVEVTYRGSYSDQYDNEYSGAVSIPSTITYNGTTYSVISIGNKSFCSCESLTSVTIPNSVTSIGDRAFCYCSSLTSITIPNSVTYIGDYAFEGTGIYNDESNWENNVLYIDDCLIEAKKSISGAYTIKENTRLIGNHAFYWCTSLTSITIGNSVTYIGDYAFVSCSSIDTVVWNAKNCADFEWNSAPFEDSDSDSIISFSFGDSVKHIPANLCFDMENLTSLIIPESVTSIGSDAFDGCRGCIGSMLADAWQDFTAHPVLERLGLWLVASHNNTIEILFVDEIHLLFASVGRDCNLTAPLWIESFSCLGNMSQFQYSAKICQAEHGVFRCASCSDVSELRIIKDLDFVFHFPSKFGRLNNTPTGVIQCESHIWA